MATGNVFKDNGYTYTSGAVFNDAGQTLATVGQFYVGASGKATWVTALNFYGAGAVIGATVKLLLYIPGNDFASNASTGLTDAIDLTVASGWNTVTLPTPRALPVWSGTGAIQKFSVGVYTGTAANYVAHDLSNNSTIPSGLTGLVYSASPDTNTPNSRGSYRYGTWPAMAGATGGFNFWNGADVEVTDVSPGGSVTADTALAVTVGRTAAATNSTTSGSSTVVTVGRTAVGQVNRPAAAARTVAVGLTAAATVNRTAGNTTVVTVGRTADATRGAAAGTSLGVSVALSADATVSSGLNAAASLTVSVGTTAAATQAASGASSSTLVVGTTAGATRGVGAITALPVAVSTSAAASRSVTAGSVTVVSVGLTAAAIAGTSPATANRPITVATTASATASSTAQAPTAITVTLTATAVSSSDAFVIEDWDYDALIPRKYRGYLPARNS